MVPKVVLSVVLVVLYNLGLSLYSTIMASVQASVGIKQLNADDPITYGWARVLSNTDVVSIAWWVLVILLALIWVPVLLQALKRCGPGKSGLNALVLLMLVFPALTACEAPWTRGPYEVPQYVEIGPNETAYMIPLEGASKTDQEKFMSEDYLTQNKVASKRVQLAQHKEQIGYEGSQYRYVLTQTVIKIDRTPVVREWTKATDQGTSASNQAFHVESVESIDFYIGGVVSGSIGEDNSAKFLYNFTPTKPLTAVMDSNVREFIAAELFAEYHKRTLDECRKDTNVIFAKVQEDTKAFFAPKGLTIDYVGGSEGFTYTDPKVQEAINNNFQAQQKKFVAQAEYEAQQTTNKKDVEIATAQAQVKSEQGRGEAEYIRQKGEALRASPGIVDLTIAEKWDGKRPQTEFNGGNTPTTLLPLPGSQLQPQPR